MRATRTRGPALPQASVSSRAAPYRQRSGVGTLVHVQCAVDADTDTHPAARGDAVPMCSGHGHGHTPGRSRGRRAHAAPAVFASPPSAGHTDAFHCHPEDAGRAVWLSFHKSSGVLANATKLMSKGKATALQAQCSSLISVCKRGAMLP